MTTLIQTHISSLLAEKSYPVSSPIGTPKQEVLSIVRDETPIIKLVASEPVINYTITIVRPTEKLIADNRGILWPESLVGPDGNLIFDLGEKIG